MAKTAYRSGFSPETFWGNCLSKKVSSVLILAKLLMVCKDIKDGPTYPHVQRAPLSPTINFDRNVHVMYTPEGSGPFCGRGDNIM